MFPALGIELKLLDMALRQHMEKLLQTRDPPKTFCPSEVARRLTPDELQDLGFAEWRDAMPEVRKLAWTMRDEEGSVEIVQKGEVLADDVKLDEVSGPIRLRRTTGP